MGRGKGGSCNSLNLGKADTGKSSWFLVIVATG